MSSPSSQKFWVIIPAAGVGSRMLADRPKQYLQIEQKTILEHTLLCFLEHGAFEKVFVGISEQDAYFEHFGLDQMPGVETFNGGTERADTVLYGLESIAAFAKADDWVWVHDAARPCLSKAEINILIDMLEEQTSGLVLGVPISDTIKRVFPVSTSRDLPEIKETVDRSSLWRAMTPQIFKFSDLHHALVYCRDNKLVITDEASAIEKIKQKVRMVQGSEQNIKVTLPADLNKVHNYLTQKQGEDTKINQVYKVENEAFTLRNNTMHYPRIGTGFDVHAFGAGNFITLGGVKISYEKGLIAHSDGDVLLHAIMDAMLGALALGDIGKHFPDTDEVWKGANSRSLLKAVNNLLKNQGYRLGNIDSTIIAQAPKMAPHIHMMQANIAEDLGLALSCVGIKATTTEKLGFTGRKEGIACQASVLLFPLSSGSNL